MKKILFSMMLAAAVVSGSGCLSHRVIMGQPAQAADKNVTLVQTMDVYSLAFLFPIRMVHQFWKCGEAPGEMVCNKVCDVKGSDLTCPMTTAGGMNSVSSYQ